MRQRKQLKVLATDKMASLRGLVWKAGSPKTSAGTENAMSGARVPDRASDTASSSLAMLQVFFAGAL